MNSCVWVICCEAADALVWLPLLWLAGWLFYSMAGQLSLLQHHIVAHAGSISAMPPHTHCAHEITKHTSTSMWC